MADKENYPLDALLQPLQGREAIRAFLGWEWGKYYRKLPDLINAGRVWYEWCGRPPHKQPCSYPILLLRYKIERGATGEVL